MDHKNLTSSIKSKAKELGFDLCGIASAANLKDHEPVLRNWCASGMNGEMAYLGRNIAKRIDPAQLFTGAKTVIVTGLNYYTDKKQGGGGVPVISRYAYGNNYHDVITAKLNSILDFVNEIAPGAKGKAFVDSAPLLEKAWARRAGLGWPGRHSILINRQIGSFFFLGVILLNIEMEYDEPFTQDYCGTCRLCIDECPTGAINGNRTIDVRKCISYRTIESDVPVDKTLSDKFEGRVFGCDRCQEVCPWNKNAKPNNIAEFQLSPELKLMSADDWQNLTKEKFKILFKKSAIGRTKFETFRDNISNALKSLA